jgi:hypothetical protein
VAAAVQLMTTAGTWQTLRDDWGMVGEEAAETVAVLTEHLGAFHSRWFEDPYGMRVELMVLTDPALAGIHGPRPLAAAER